MPFMGKETEQERQDAFVDLVGGTAKADSLAAIWSRCHPTGTQYDKLMRTGYYHSREDHFRRAALREGFTKKQCDAFMAL